MNDKSNGDKCKEKEEDVLNKKILERKEERCGGKWKKYLNVYMEIKLKKKIKINNFIKIVKKNM